MFNTLASRRALIYICNVYNTIQDVCVCHCALQALLKLCCFRNRHPAFQGRFYLDDDTPKHILHARWCKGGDIAALYADLESCEFQIKYTPYDVNAGSLSVDMPSIYSIDAMDLESRQRARVLQAVREVNKLKPQAAQLIGMEYTATDAESDNSAAGDDDDDGVVWMVLDFDELKATAVA